MVALDFFRQGKRKLHVAHFNHGTVHAREAEDVVLEYCKKYQIPIVVGRLSKEKPSRMSIEEFWRNERYDFLKTQQGPIVTAHHLNDVIEWWIFTALHGDPKLIPHTRDDCNVLRPFLITNKKTLYRWAHKNSVPYVDDPSNDDERFMRNHIRNNIARSALFVNPGLEKTMIKKLKKEWSSNA